MYLGFFYRWCESSSGTFLFYNFPCSYSLLFSLFSFLEFLILCFTDFIFSGWNKRSMEDESCSRSHGPPQRKISGQVGTVRLFLFLFFLFCFLFPLFFGFDSWYKRFSINFCIFPISALLTSISYLVSITSICNWNTQFQFECPINNQRMWEKVGRVFTEYFVWVYLNACRKESVTLPDNEAADAADIEQSLNYSNSTRMPMGLQQTGYFAMVIYL